MSEGVASWWLMSWGTAQAGDRASQTGHYGQWWDRDAEQHTDASGRYNLHHSSFSSSSLGGPCHGMDSAILLVAARNPSISAAACSKIFARQSLGGNPAANVEQLTAL